MGAIIRLEQGQVDLDSGFGRIDGEEVRLTERERALLDWLASRPHRAISREELLGEVWGYAPGVHSRTVDATMRRLRQKVEREPSQPRHLITAHGAGYRFAPLEAEPRVEVRTNLIRPSGRLFGRRALLEELRRRWEAGERWITLVGPGGGGKTALAEALATELVDRGVPVYVLDLIGVNDAERLARRIIRVLGLSAGEADPAEVLARALGSLERALVVLDGAEHLVDEASVLVRDWLEAAPELSVLVTSRMALGDRGERLLPVEGLQADAAVALLRARSGLDADDASDELLLQVADRVDRLPLALELCARRARLHGMHIVLDALRRDGASALHLADLTQAAERTWDLLDDRERAILSELSVFRGGFTLNTAVDVLSAEHGAALASTLDRLVDTSVLRPTGRPGRLVVYEGVRAFALRHLPDEREARVRARLHQVLLERYDPDPGSGSEENEPILAGVPEVENLRDGVTHADPDQAARMAILLARIEWRTESRGVALGALDRAVERGPSTLLLGRLHVQRAEILRGLGRSEDAVHALELASDLFEATGRHDWLVVPRLFGTFGADTVPTAELEALLFGFVQVLDRRWHVFRAYAAVNLGQMARLVGRDDHVELAIDELGRCARVGGDPLAEIWQLRHRGFRELTRGNHEAALDWMRHVVQLSRRHGYPRLRDSALGSLAYMLEVTGHYEEAVDTARTLLRALAGRHEGALAQNTRANEAWALLGVGETVQAKATFHAFVAESREPRQPLNLGESLRGLGLALALEGHYDRADAVLRESHEALVEAGVDELRGECCALLAVVAAALDEDPQPWLVEAEDALPSTPVHQARIQLVRLAFDADDGSVEPPRSLRRFARVVERVREERKVSLR